MGDFILARPNASSNWQRVSAAHPCPICGKSDYCALTVDGRLAKCMRVEAGAFRTDRDKNGSPFYLHRLGGEARSTFELPPDTGSAGAHRANPDSLHAVYDALLGGLILSANHREQLHRRGLTDDEIDRRLYRSLPVQGRAAKARELGERFGAEVLLSVPGFVRRNKDGRQYVTIAGQAGLLVPVRDTAGRIAALKIRRDGSDNRSRRYSYLTSVNDCGPSPGAPVHAPLGLTGPCTTARLTEGELKADVATALSGLATIGLPGVAHWKAVLPLLRELRTTTVRIAFDADAADKAAVARALAACVEGLAPEGFAVEVARWDAEHKGIDDALAAGVAVEVLAGDEARAYVAEMLALATAGEPPPEPNPLDRLDNVLAGGGVEGLYGDGQLLDALARLAETNLAGFAARKNQLKREGISIRDFERVLTGRRAAIRAELPPRVVEAGYRVSGGRLIRDVQTANGPVETPLANFVARIIAETTRDDGAERSVCLMIEGRLCDGRLLPRVEVPAAEFGGLDWILPAWGASAVVYAGRGTADHLRVAMQLLSSDVAQRTVYAHLGWRKIGERWTYLHAGGAIGTNGLVDGVEVVPPDALSRYVLPAPLAGDNLRRAVRASLALLDLAPERVAFPLLSAVYRAVLGGTDFTAHLIGQTGIFKSELAALAQQHYGAELDARHLPANWSSTGNSLESIAFAAKDALLVVDDFAPSGSAADVAKLHREAERLLRAQGNAAGRQRLRADGSLRPAKPPRGLILSTGEDVPRGQSVRARLLVVEVERGDIDAAKLTAAQRDAADGLYAASMAGFVRWLAPQYDSLRDRLAAERTQLRQRAASDGQHARTPGIVADLALGLRHLLDFAVAAGALSAGERAALWERGWSALCEAGSAQAEHGRAADPVEAFVRLLAAALASGRAHVAAPDGGYPDTPAAWGWRRETIRGSPEWAPQGRRVGWVDGEALYLEPEASFAAAQEMAGAQGEGLAVSVQRLRRRLKERGLLASTDAKRETLTIRRVVEGASRNVLHLDSSCLFAKPDKPDSDGGSSGEMSGYECRVAVQDGQNPTSDPTSDPTEKTGRNGQNVGFVGSDSDRELSRNGNETAPYLAPGLSEDDVRTRIDP